MNNKTIEQKLKDRGFHPHPSTWNGEYKQFTKDCEDCVFYNKIGNEDICNGGLAWKRLFRVKNPRKCFYC